MENSEFIDKLKKEVSEAKKRLETIKIELAKAKAIGLDIRQLTERFEAQKTQIELVEKVYKI